MDLKKFVLEGNPVCRKEAVIVGDHFRITMLTTALIRFVYSEDGGFEDRATQMVCNRDFPVPEFRVSDSGEELHIYTKDLEITIAYHLCCSVLKSSVFAVRSEEHTSELQSR